MPAPHRIRALVARSALFGIITAVTVSVGFATTPAQAAPAPVTPLYPIGAVTPPMTPAGTERFALVTVNGAPVVDGAQTMPSGTTVYVARFRDTGPASGVVTPPAALGDFTMTTNGPPAPAVSLFVVDDNGQVFPGDPTQPPVGTVFSASWVEFTNPGTWTYDLDFSTLAGGELPAGSVIWAADVDVCRANAIEAATFTSNLASPWMQYYADSGSGTPGSVTADPTTGTYTITATCPTGANNVTQSFRTTSAVSHATITLTGADPATNPRSSLVWGLTLPVQPAAPALTLTKLINGTDATAAPGPDVTIGDPVTWTYNVANSGNTTLTNVTVTDNQVPDADISCTGGANTIALLTPGQTESCTATGTAQLGQYTNTAAATGTPSTTDGSTPLTGVTPPTATAESWYTGDTTASTTPPAGTTAKEPELANTGSTLPGPWLPLAALTTIGVGLALARLRRRQSP